MFALEATKRNAVLAFLERLRTEAGIGRKRVVIDFRHTQLMVASGTLLFAAELARINELTAPNQLVRAYVPPRDRVVAQVLQHVGIAKMVGLRAAHSVHADNVRYWRIHSGIGVKGEEIGAAMAGYEDCFAGSENAVSQQLYRGLSEAVTNCHQHAYAGKRGDGLADLRRWWMFSQLKDGDLSVLVCDLGIGIPRSLRDHAELSLRERVFSWLRTAVINESDSSLIRAAVAVGKTRTGESNRGFGLADISSVIDGLGGRLTIWSNAGAYSYQDGEEQCSDFPNGSIRGTLVQWRIPVPTQATQ